METTMTVTPKHLANDLGIKVEQVRALLRARYGTPQPNKGDGKEAKKWSGERWRWDEKEGAKVRTWLARSLGKKVNGK
jgi:hypothetical protein